MNILEFLHKIDTMPLGQVYLLVGEDRYQLWLAEQALINKIFPVIGEQDIVRFDQSPDANTLAVAIASPGFFASETLGIVEDSSWLSSDKRGEERKKDETRIGDILGDLPKESKLIIKAFKADKRVNLYKKMTTFAVILEGDLLKGQSLKTYVQQVLKEYNLRLDSNALRWILEQWELLEGVSVGLVRQEFEKMWLYSRGALLTQAEVENILAELPEISAFKLIDAWGSGGPEKSLSLLKSLLDNGEVPLKLLGLFTWHVRNLWQVKILETESKDRIAAKVGIRPFQVDRLVATARRLSVSQVRDLMLGLAEADLALKSGHSSEIVLEKLLLIGHGK